MRRTLVGGWTVALLVALAGPASAQWFGWDARSTGMAGIVLHRNGGLEGFNVAYRAVPRRPGAHGAKLTLPIPLGIVQALKDSVAFNFDSSYFNPIALANYILNPPVFYQLKQPPVPNNDVFLFIGKDSLFVDLGQTKEVIPTDEVKVAGVNRLLNLGGGFSGFYVGVMLWEHHKLGTTLNTNLQNFLFGQPAQHNTLYAMNGDEIAQMGVAPGVSYSQRLAKVGSGGLYAGAGVNYYLGFIHGVAVGFGGIQTGDTIFSGGNPVRPRVNFVTEYNKFGSGLGHGIGVDAGLAWVTDKVEIGFGINDVSTTLTWPKNRLSIFAYDTTKNDFTTRDSLVDVQRTTKVPTTYLLNAAFEVGTNTTAGAEIRNAGFGTITRIGVEHRIGPLALRGGLTRDLRKILQFAAGTGIRFGPFSLDLAVASNSNSLATSRGWILASSFSVY
ncbi:MAG TPA: hypothetical protein VMH88_03195 [Gemmatimonadales bacterium]|nr:hypothetical protein [Gemmatimonadales bacterium]